MVSSDTVHTIRSTLMQTGDSITTTTEVDNEPPVPHLDIKIPESVKLWFSRVYQRIHSAKDTPDGEMIAAVDDRNIGTDLLPLLFPDVSDLPRLINSPGKLIFDVTADEIALSRLPWESCVQADWQALGIKENPISKIALIRSPVPPTDKWTIKETEQLRILVAGANPIGSPTPNFVKELDAINAGLSKVSDRCNVKEINSVSIPTLQSAIAKYRPHIVHFVSHGGRGVLELEDAEGKPIPVSGSDIASALSQGIDDISVFVSTACLAMQADPDRKITSLGRPLITQIPYIIGMQLQISDAQVVRFSREFYQSLANSNGIIEAYLHARNMLFRYRPQSPEWIGPVLYKSYYKDPSVFSSYEINSLVKTYADTLYPLVIALRNDSKYVDGWNSVINIVNQVELSVIDGYRSRKYFLNPNQIKEWNKIDKLIPPIRELLIAIEDFTAVDNPELRIKEKFGKAASGLLKILSDFYYALVAFHETFR